MFNFLYAMFRVQSGFRAWSIRISMLINTTSIDTCGFLASFLRPRNRSYACMLTHWLLCNADDKYEGGGVRVALACVCGRWIASSFICPTTLPLLKMHASSVGRQFFARALPISSLKPKADTKSNNMRTTTTTTTTRMGR